MERFEELREKILPVLLPSYVEEHMVVLYDEG